MPQKRKKYNARFPQGRIKKIMQTDEEVGKVAAPVPIMISRALELFVESLLMKTMEVTNARQARTLSPSHMRQCIMAESRFDFLRELVKDIPNISTIEESAEPMPTNVDYNLSPMVGNILDQYLKSNPWGQGTGMERLKYQRTMSHDPGSGTLDLSCNSTHQQPLNRGRAMPSSSSGSVDDDTTAGILKRKLLDATRKYLSADSNGPNFSGVGKLSRLDSSPGSFSDAMVSRAAASQSIEPQRDSPLGAKRRRKSNEAEKPVTVPNLSSLLPPTVSANISSPIIKIDYNQPSFGGRSGQMTNASQITPIINIDFSNLVSQSAAANGSKLALRTAELNNGGLSTPNLTTPTQLNYAPFAAALTGAVASPPTVIRPNINLPTPTTGPSSSNMIASKSVLEMDEDYDNI